MHRLRLVLPPCTASFSPAHTHRTSPPSMLMHATVCYHIPPQPPIDASGLIGSPVPGVGQDVLRLSSARRRAPFKRICRSISCPISTNSFPCLLPHFLLSSFYLSRTCQYAKSGKLGFAIPFPSSPRFPLHHIRILTFYVSFVTNSYIIIPLPSSLLDPGSS